MRPRRGQPLTGSGEPGWTTRDAEPYGAEDALYLIGLTYPGCGTYRGPVAIGRPAVAACPRKRGFPVAADDTRWIRASTDASSPRATSKPVG